eukprot:c979_g1_i1.p1 GENE.c979_g1_i1~~c979_g1_i1.p1  ORF type:complete len:326 (+),score=57.95 c979_g1_i1:55-978(+)
MLKAERKRIALAKLSNTPKSEPNDTEQQQGTRRLSTSSYASEIDMTDIETHPSFLKNIDYSHIPPLPLQQFVLPCDLGKISYIPNFVSEQEERDLISCITGMPPEKWTKLSRRRLQMYGGTPHLNGMFARPLPRWTEGVVERLCEWGVFGDETAAKPNHILLNEYRPGQGIMPHKDGPLYAPRVAIISLQATACLEFWESVELSRTSASKACIFCEPRSLLIFEGTAYLDHVHGICEREFDEPAQCHNFSILEPEFSSLNAVPRGTRLSLTIRRVLRLTETEPLMSEDSQENERRKEREFAKSVSEK